MNLAPFDISRARILVSNDDGIHAPGLRVLEKIARALSKDVWVVAPESEQSGASHSLTVRTPLRIRKISPRRFAVNGTPTDCVLLGALQILKDSPPDIVLSGVNPGGNLAEDVSYSGTVAVAMEGVLIGYRAVALSQIISPQGTLHWRTAEHYGPKIIRKLAEAPWPRDVFVNINFPGCPVDDVEGIEVTQQGRRRLQERITEAFDPFQRPYYWIGSPRLDKPSNESTDIAATSRGFVSVTPLHVDHTHAGMKKALKGVFK
jgi:5'-nucleotidase